MANPAYCARPPCTFVPAGPAGKPGRRKRRRFAVSGNDSILNFIRDHRNPTTKEILGDEAFKKLQQIVADTYETSESTLYRINPELSNPPEEVAKVALDFWRPKAQMAAAAKPKTVIAEPAVKDATKKQ